MNERYIRQLNISEIGPNGQNRLRSSSVLVVGAGGLGSILLFCLAGTGVGRIGISEFDTVSESNLNRQFLFNTEDIGKNKLSCALSVLQKLNPDVLYEPYSAITSQNAQSIVKNYDVVVSAVDNLKVRLILNEACCQCGIPLVNGSIEAMGGLVNTVHPGENACLECIYGGVSDYTCTPASFAPVVSTVSALMAQETLLLLLGQTDPLKNHILHIDARNMEFLKLPSSQSPDCPVCSNLKKATKKEPRT